MRQAYDYWQDQPGSYRRRRRRPTPARRIFFVGRPGHTASSSHVRRSPHGRGARVALARRLDRRHRTRSYRGARTGRASAEAAAALIAGARFSRLRGTRCGAGILKTVRLVTNLHESHTVRISTARQLKSTDETLAGPLARWPRSQPGVLEIASCLAAELADRKRFEVAHRSTSSKQAGRQTETQTPTRPDARLRRAVFVRCTAASRIKQRTVRQAMFIPNHRVCTLCAGFQPPILPPYRITSSATRQPLCVPVRVRVPVCARLRVRVRLSVCTSVCASVCACLRLSLSSRSKLSAVICSAVYAKESIYTPTRASVTHAYVAHMHIRHTLERGYPSTYIYTKRRVSATRTHVYAVYIRVYTHAQKYIYFPNRRAHVRVIIVSRGDVARRRHNNNNNNDNNNNN